MRRYLFFIASFFISFWNCYSQSASAFLSKAKIAFEQQDYFLAAQHYTAAGLKLKKNKSESLHAAISYFESGDLAKAIPIFEYLSHEKKFKKTAQTYLIKSYAHHQQFSQAIVALKNYYKLVNKDVEQKNYIKNEILRAANGIRYKRKEPIAIVELLGGNINTANEESSIYPSINHAGQYYFSAVRSDNFGGKRTVLGEANEKSGKVRTDIFTVKSENGIWSNPQYLNPLLNSARNESVVGFANHGEVLLFYRSWDNEEGDIYVDTFSSTNQIIDYKFFESPVCSKIGDRDLTLFQDSILIFSSNRIGGYGGYDLYLSFFRNGYWTEPRNLGPEVNTPFNEVSPYLAKDGHTLYFSSDNFESIGGYDIFKTKFKAESRLWAEIENLGIPINSAGDEIDFRLNTDGLAGTFTSDRKEGCKGNKDIYISYFKDELEEQIYASSGSTLGFILEGGPDKMDFSHYLNSEKEDPGFPSKLIFRDYTIEPLFYKDEDYIKDVKNKKQLDQLISMLQINPELEIQLIGHSYELGGSAVNLYYSCKLTNAIREYLTSKNISSSRISQIGVGDYFPVSKSEVNGTRISTAEKWNQRIEFSIVAKDSSLVKLNYPEAPIADFMKNTAMHQFRKMRTNLSYSILLGDAEQLLNHPLLNQKEHSCYINKDAQNSTYQYYLGIFPTFKDAQKYLNQITEKNRESLKIIPFLQGVKINRNEVINYVKKYPDLFYYIKYAKLD